MHRPASSQLRFFASLSLLVLAATLVVTTASQAQTGHVLHDFTGNNDGSIPEGLVTVDQTGNVYGSTQAGGIPGLCEGFGGCGMVFRAAKRHGAFTYAPLYFFHGNDGAQPFSGVIIGPDGAIYGTTFFGGNPSCGDCGVVFKLTPPPTFCRMVLCGWDETLIYSPSGGSDPAGLAAGIVFDNAGNIYGASFSGGAFGSGAVYKLSPSGGTYTETTLYSFTGGDDGANSMTNVALDAAGDIYGATTFGGANGHGTVFKLVHEAGGYTFQLLHTFSGQSDLGMPSGSVVLDSAGNLYGAGYSGIFQITPSGTYTLIDTQALGLQSPINIDAVGNIYGTTYGGGQYGNGSAFKDTYSNGTWTHNVVFSFDGQFGGLPLSDVGLDSSGNMYVTATFGGQSQGTLVQVTP
jgi:uncharacterized repeat protein (TIGR03803 family)